MNFRALCLASGLLLWGIPPAAFSHGSEYVYAKLIVEKQPRRVVLELSLEFNDNPIIESKEQARSVLETDFSIESGAGGLRLGDLHEETVWSCRREFDSGAPVPVPAAESNEHELLCAKIDLSSLVSGSLCLSVLKSSEQAVIFWIQEPSNKSRRWKMLLAGDTSPAVELPASE